MSATLRFYTMVEKMLSYGSLLPQNFNSIRRINDRVSEI